MKEELIKLIEAYADARATQNPTLIQFAAQQLSGVLQKVEIKLVETEETKQEIKEEQEPS